MNPRELALAWYAALTTVYAIAAEPLLGLEVGSRRTAEYGQGAGRARLDFQRVSGVALVLVLVLALVLVGLNDTFASWLL